MEEASSETLQMLPRHQSRNGSVPQSGVDPDRQPDEVVKGIQQVPSALT